MFEKITSSAFLKSLVDNKMRWWVFCFVFFSANIQQTSWNLCCNLFKLDLIGLFSTVVTSFLKLGITVWKIMHILISAIDRNTFITENQNVGALCLPLNCLWTTTLTNGYLDYFFKKAIWDYKRYVFIRCRTEYEVKDQEAAKGMKWLQRFHAFVLFLGELYLNLEVSTFQ